MTCSITNNVVPTTTDGFQLAQLLALPDRYWKWGMPGVLAVSKAVEIGHFEALYLRVKLRKDLFNQLLVDQGILQPGQTKS